MRKYLTLILTAGITASSFAGIETDPVKKGSDELTPIVSPMKIRQRDARPDLPGSFVIDFGFNMLQDAPSLMDVGLIGSRTINFYYFRDIAIGSSHFTFLPGIGLGLDRYKLDDNITLTEGTVNGENVVALTELSNSDIDFKKSQLITNYIDIPLELRYYLNPDDKKRSFNVGVGAKAGVRFGSLTKLKYKQDDETIKTKEKRDFGLNRFRYGLTGRIGIGGFNFFYYQSLSTLFDEGPVGTEDTANITIGISVVGF